MLAYASYPLFALHESDTLPSPHPSHRGGGVCKLYYIIHRASYIKPAYRTITMTWRGGRVGLGHIYIYDYIYVDLIYIYIYTVAPFKYVEGRPDHAVPEVV